MSLSDIPAELHRLYEIHEWRHASAVLTKDFAGEWAKICGVLLKFRLLKSRVLVPGGSKSFIAGAIDSALTELGWEQQRIEATKRL